MRMRWKDGKRKALTLSYDDGVVQDIRLVEILDRHGIKATFNLNSGSYFPEDGVRERYFGRMKKSEAKALFAGGAHELATHGYTHPFLDRISAAACVREIFKDREMIAAEYGGLVRGHAYPYGAYNDSVKEILANCGIRYARTTTSTNSFGIPNDFLAWNPTCHHKSKELPALTRHFLDGEVHDRDGAWLFYVWGHSYEFDNDDNWHVIETFAERVGGREDVWYATNIEICDYVTAFRRLETSADGTLVYNPSATDVWFFKNGCEYCVRSGEELTIS